jgi:glycosyltransferase involved in cell wall biosynthesis
MKIAIFTDTFYPKVDGIVTSILNFSKELAKKGHKIIIFAPRYKGEQTIKIHPNIKIYRCFSFSLLSYKEVKISIPPILKVIRKFKEFDPHIIHLHTPGTIGLLGILCSRLYEIPSIATYHTIVSEQITYLSLKRLTKLDKLIEIIKSKRVRIRLGNGNYFSNKFKYFSKKEVIRKIIDLITFRGIRNKQFNKRIVWKISCNFYNRCDLVIVPSKSIVKELRKHKFTKPIKVLSNGVDLKNFSPKKNYRNGKVFKIIHIGRVGFEKNIDVIIRSFNLLLKEKENVSLKIVGDGPATNSLKNLAKSLGLSHKIKFVGYMSGKKLVNEYKSGDVFVAASTMETQGLTILEAMSCGLPVIGVNKYAIPDLVKHNVNGYVAEPFDDKKIKEYMVKLIDNPHLLKKFGKKSVDIAKRHDLRKVVGELECLYEQVKVSFEVK